MKAQVKDYQSMFMRKSMPEFESGDTVQVMFRVREGDKQRLQTFEGVVMQVKGKGLDRTVTLRKMSGNVAVERIFPLHSPVVAEIKRMKKGNVRRARLYYLRGLQGKAARIREERADVETVAAGKVAATEAKA